MPIRFSRSGSTLQLGATTLLASASLWFGSVVYAQTQPTFNRDAFPPAPQTLQRNANEQNQPFSHVPRATQQPGNFQTPRVTTQHLPNNAGFDFSSGRLQSPANPSVAQSPSRTTARLDINNLSRDSVQQLLGNPAVGNVHAAQTQVTVPAHAEAFARGTASPIVNSNVATASYREPVVAAASGVHQLSAISMTDFEQKLLDRFGGHLKATTSADGRLIRVSLPVKPVQNVAVAPVTMLVDRKTGELQYEGPADFKTQWHQLISQLDSVEPATQVAQAPVTRPNYQPEALPPQVRQVAYQQDDLLRPGTQIQGVRFCSAFAWSETEWLVVGRRNTIRCPENRCYRPGQTIA